MKTTKQLENDFRLMIFFVTQALMLTIMLYNSHQIAALLIALTYSAVFMFYAAYVQDEIKVRSGSF